MSIKNEKAVTIQIVGVGGQGALTVSKVIGNAALAKEMPVVMSEIHGMAQRGGVVQTTIRLGEAESPLPFSSDMSILVAFEPMEAYRARDLVTRETIVVINTDPIRPVSVSSGGKKYPDVKEIIAEIEKHAKEVYSLSAMEKATEAGNPRTTNIAMLGAMAACGVLPFDADDLRGAIKASIPSKSLDVNLKAFDLGLETITEKNCKQ
jgi:indolepyruvate ferredoxin oxidoreductase, beta subunit